MIDLHTHTTASDGTDTPEELVARARLCGVTALAITDHDTVDGVAPAAAAARGTDLWLIAGVELSTAWEDRHLHLVGLFVDIDDGRLQEALAQIRTWREQRNRRIADALRACGICVDYDALVHRHAVVGRPHIAQAIAETGAAPDAAAAMARYLLPGTAGYVPRTVLRTDTAIDVIHSAGGVAVLAHPETLRLPRRLLHRLLGALRGRGLDAVETITGTANPSWVRTARHLARRNDLLPSGGSDYHGARKPHLRLGRGTGHMYVPQDIATGLHRRAAEIRAMGTTAR